MENLILCFESGGTKLVAALFDSHGNILERQVIRRSLTQKAEDTVKSLCQAGKKMAGERGQPSAVGWGFGGTVDRSTGNPVYCYHEDGWGEFDAPAIVRGEFSNIPVFVENDCNMGALAEAWKEDCKPPEMLFFATLGTGIGGGIVRRGEIQQFSRAGEGEIGHLVVDPGGISCACGNRGCLETVCSGPGMENLSLQVIGKKMNSYEIMENYRKGDPDAQKIVEKGADYLAIAFSSIINILAPDEIVLGGGLMWKNEDFLKLIENRSKALSFPVLRENVRFRISSLGENLVCKGAYIFACQNLSGLQK
jgi:glucokinase